MNSLKSFSVSIIFFPKSFAYVITNSAVSDGENINFSEIFCLKEANDSGRLTSTCSPKKFRDSLFILIIYKMIFLNL